MIRSFSEIAFFNNNYSPSIRYACMFAAHIHSIQTMLFMAENSNIIKKTMHEICKFHARIKNSIESLE